MDMPTLSFILRAVLILALLPVLFVGASLAWNHPPLLDAHGIGVRLKTYFTTHVAETRVNHPFPELRPRHFNVSPALVLSFGARALPQLGWPLSSQQPDAHTVTAVATTLLWRFKDDITLRADATPDGGSILYVRSESRVGKGDLGANVRRVINATEEIAEVPALEVTAAVKPL